MFYIPNTENLYYGDDEWVVVGDVQYRAPDAPDAARCAYEPCTLDGVEYVITENRNGPVIGWTGTPRDPAEVAALRKKNADAIVLAEISRLEGLETKRRMAEAAPDDAGGTPDGRAWLKSNRESIAAERAKL